MGKTTFYCFVAKLKYLNEDDFFCVPFNILAEDKYKAKTILEEWLSNPEQTGYKFECCVDIEEKPSQEIIVAPDKAAVPTKCKGCKHIGFRYPYASMYPCIHCVRANAKDYYEEDDVNRSAENVRKAIQTIDELFKRYSKDTRAFTVDYDECDAAIYCNYVPYVNDSGFAVSDNLLYVTETAKEDLETLKDYLNKNEIVSRTGYEWSVDWGYGND